MVATAQMIEIVISYEQSFDVCWPRFDGYLIPETLACELQALHTGGWGVGVTFESKLKLCDKPVGGCGEPQTL